MTAYGALSTPSSATGSCPFNEWAEKNRAETQPLRPSSLGKHRGPCPRSVIDLDCYPEGDVFCRRCGAVLGVTANWAQIHAEHKAAARR